MYRLQVDIDAEGRLQGLEAGLLLRVVGQMGLGQLRPPVASEGSEDEPSQARQWLNQTLGAG